MSSPAAGVGIASRAKVLIRGIKSPFLLLEANALTSISSIAEELGVVPVALIPTFWAEQEAHPKSFPKGRTCIKEGSKNIAVKQIANCTLYLVPCTLILLFFVILHYF